MKARAASDLKEYNRMLVYNLVKAEGGISKADIARRLELSVPTVIKIEEYFARLGIFVDGGEGEAALGRKPMLLSFYPEAAYAVGAEYDGVHLSVGLVDLAGRVSSIRKAEAPPDLGLLLGSLLESEVEALIASSGLARERVKGLGLGVPAVVHEEEGLIGLAPLVGVERTVDYKPLISKLEARLGMPIKVANDANAAALGEVAARGEDCGGDLIFVILGRGVGAGLILDGRLRQGPSASAGEIGYMVFDRRARGTSPGPGWLETSMGLGAFWAEVARQGSPDQASVERVASFLALGLANLCIALDVRTVVLGRAGKESFGPALLSSLRDNLHRSCPMEICCEFSVAPEPGVAGAAGLAQDAWLQATFAG